MDDGRGASLYRFDPPDLSSLLHPPPPHTSSTPYTS